MTLGALAARAGCSVGYLSQIENERRDHPPSPTVLRRLEDALGIHGERLVVLGQWESAPKEIRARMARVVREHARFAEVVSMVRERGLASAYAAGALAEAFERVVSESEAEDGWSAVGGAGAARVPVVNRVRDGYPRDAPSIEAARRNADDHVMAPWVRTDRAFAIRVVGDSMAPAYAQGDVVVVDPGEPATDGADCFLVVRGGSASAFRRVFGVETGTSIRAQPLDVRNAPEIVARGDLEILAPAVCVISGAGGAGGAGHRR